MEINDGDIFDFMKEVTSSLGRIEEGVKNNAEHTSAVSRKADRIREELSEHVRDTGAHGLDAQEKASKNILSWFGWAVGAGGLALALVKWRG